jgi:hypothetical protein
LAALTGGSPTRNVWILPFAVGATSNAGAKPSIPSESGALALITDPCVEV